MDIKAMNVDELKSFAEENSIEVEGSGKNGAVTRKDLEKAIGAAAPEDDAIEEQYVVIKPFKDLKDGNYIYGKVGEVYPRNNKKPDPERVKELSTNNNKRKEPVIKVKGE